MKINFITTRRRNNKAAVGLYLPGALKTVVALKVKVVAVAVSRQFRTFPMN